MPGRRQSVFGDVGHLQGVSSSSAGQWSGRLRTLAFDVAVAGVVVGVAAAVGARLNLPGGIATIWLGGGLLIAIFASVPPRRWGPGVVLGLVAFYGYSLSLGWAQGASWLRASGEILASVAAAMTIRRVECLPLRSQVDVARLAGIGILVGVIRVLFLKVDLAVDPAFDAEFDRLAGSVFLNSIAAVLIIVPLGASLAIPPAWRWPSRRQWGWSLFLASSVLLFVLMLFIAPAATWWQGMEYLVFPLTIAAAATQQRRALATWLTTVAIVGSAAVIQGIGPFYRPDRDGLELQSDTFRAQAFVIVLALTAWVLFVIRESWAETSRQLDRAMSRLQAAVDRAPVPMAFGPLIGGPIEANEAMAAFFRVPLDKLPSLDWVGLTHPDDVAEDMRLTEMVLSGQTDGYQHSKRYILEDGTVKWADVWVARIDDGSPTPRGVVQVIDVTAERTARMDLERSERRFRALVDQAAIPMSYGPMDNGLKHFNDARRDFHELTHEELERADFRDLIHPEDVKAMQPLQDAFLAGEIDRYRVLQRFVMPDGRVKWGDKTVTHLDLDHDSEELVVVQIVDVTPEVQALERLQHLVDTEPVTGLGSRSWITTALEHSLRESPGTGAVAVLFIDLSEYAVVTRTLGYEAGDQILGNLARLIAGNVPESYLVGRFWGDRILIVAPDVTRVEEVEDTAARILRAVATEQIINGNRISRTGNVGIALSRHGSTVTSMLRSADEALTEATQMGRSRLHMVHDNLPEWGGADSLRREHDLREALDQRQFVLHYQPQVRLIDGAVFGYEALVRWQHPERGLLTPAEFMDLMESSGLIVDLGRQVLEMACAAIAAAPHLSLPVSVNVSALEITEPDWLDFVTNTILRSGLAADRLTIELTETALLRLTPDAEQALTAIRAMGMGLHIDDFGTGYASIGVLQQVPLTGLKLDRKFVSALAEPTQADLDLIASIASMAKGLRLEPIAEGIETHQQATLLRNADWIYGQGYLYGKPAPTFLDIP